MAIQLQPLVTVWQGWAELSLHTSWLQPPPPLLLSLLFFPSLSARLGPLSKAPSSWEQAGFKCLSPGVIEVATHGVSSVTTRAGLCQGQNEFIGERKVEEERRDILWQMMNNLKVHWYYRQMMKREARWDKRRVVEGGLAWLLLALAYG